MVGDLTAKSIPSVGGLIGYLCSGVGTFAFFRQRDWDQVLACLHRVKLYRRRRSRVRVHSHCDQR